MAEKRSYGLLGPAGLQIKGKAKAGLQRPRKGPSPLFSEGGGEGGEGGEGQAGEDDPKALLNAQLRRADARLSRSVVGGEESEYDSVYDSMQAHRTSAPARGLDRAPRYVGAILEAAKRREIENERLYERKMAKEAEAEAGLYGEKEKFLTSAYRRKLDARREYEEEEKRKQAEDARRAHLDD
ncbi:MAG: hypothetical protein SGPRY_011817 [Prymnesium sp.]